MVINSSFKHKGQDIQVKYYDLSKCQQVYGVCFYHDEMLIVRGENWGLVGGHIEHNETFEETLIREVQEETNTKVMKYFPIGVQEVTNSDAKTLFQLRCLAIVEPIGKQEIF